MIVDGTNLSIIKGDTEYLSVICDNYKLIDGEDVVELTVRLSPTNQKLIYKKIEEFERGNAEIKFLPEDTKYLNPGVYVYDVQITFANGDVKTIVPCSRFTIKKEVTYD